MNESLSRFCGISFLPKWDFFFAAYKLWDLNTRHSFNLKSVIIEPGCGIENLFDYTDDRPYNSNYATLTPGRSFYISLSLKFKS